MRRAAAVRRIHVYAFAALGTLFTGISVGCTEAVEVLEIFDPLIPDGPAPNPNAPRRVSQTTIFFIGVGQTVTLDLSTYFTDPNDDPLEYRARATDQGIARVSVSGSVATIIGVAYGTTDVVVTARDPGGLEAQQRLRFTVQNRPPEAVGSIPEQTVDVGDTVRVDVSPYFSDADGDALAYEADVFFDDRASASMSGSLMSIVGLSEGSTSITVTARDPAGDEARQRTRVTVTPSNHPPEAVGSIPEQTVDVGDTVRVDVSPYFSDPDGDALTYEADVFFDHRASASMSGSLMSIVGLSEGGTSITVTARDPAGEEARQQTRVTVIQPNRPPEVTDEIPDQTVDVGDTVWFNVFPYFDDPDGDRLTYSAVSADESIATVETPRSTVRITGVAAGSTTVTVTARDPDGLEASQEVGVTVNSADSGNRATSRRRVARRLR